MADSSTDEFSRLIDVMRWGMSEMHRAGVFYGHGTDNAWDEMLQLAFGSLGLPLEAPPVLLTAALLPEERQTLLALIRRRVDERVPVPYLTQMAWFARLPFYIDERALIPRSPFAEVIENGFEPYLAGESPDRLLELCTGSGCIATICALRYPRAEVVATDISEAALAVAQINVARHRVGVTLVQGDLFADVEGRFDVIVANPPYVAEEDWAGSPVEFHHEPKLALTAGEDGLDLVRRILRSAGDYLTENGVLLVEVGDSDVYFGAAFPSCPVQWIPLERGGSGVFMIHREDLLAYLDTGEMGDTGKMGELGEHDA